MKQKLGNVAKCFNWNCSLLTVNSNQSEKRRIITAFLLVEIVRKLNICHIKKTENKDGVCHISCSEGPLVIRISYLEFNHNIYYYKKVMINGFIITINFLKRNII